MGNPLGPHLLNLSPSLLDLLVPRICAEQLPASLEEREPLATSTLSLSLCISLSLSAVSQKSFPHLHAYTNAA